jgi:hypothetical protein
MLQRYVLDERLDSAQYRRRIMVVCGNRGGHIVPPCFVPWLGQVLVGECKTEEWTRVVVTSILLSCDSCWFLRTWYTGAMEVS